MASDTSGSQSEATGAFPSASAVTELSLFGKVRLVGFGLVVLAVLGFAVVVLGELFSLLVLGWTADVGAELGIHRLHAMAIATVILTTLLGVAVQVYRPTRQVASMLGAFGSITVATLVTAGVGDPLTGVLPFLVLVTLATLLHPAGRALLRPGPSYSPVMLALVALAAVPMFAFVVDQVGLQLGASDAHAAAGHYTVMAQLGLVPLVYGLFAAVGLRGWRVAAWVAALPIAYYGLLSMSFTGQAGSTGVLWGVAAVLWAVGFIVASESSRVVESPALRRRLTR